MKLLMSKHWSPCFFPNIMTYANNSSPHILIPGIQFIKLLCDGYLILWLVALMSVQRKKNLKKSSRGWSRTKLRSNEDVLGLSVDRLLVINKSTFNYLFITHHRPWGPLLSPRHLWTLNSLTSRKSFQPSLLPLPLIHNIRF